MKEIVEHICISENNIEELKELVKPCLTEKRYSHSLFVMAESERLGKIYLPDKINNLKAAALLHDITKIADFEKQLQYCNEFGIILDTGQLSAPEVLHSITATEVAKRKFSDYVDEEILSAIRYHTTGREDMTIFDSIIYLADYIEESRTHDICRKLRKYFYDRINTCENKLTVLYDTMIYSFDSTLTYLISKGSVIDKDTVAARNYFMKLRNDRSENAR